MTNPPIITANDLSIRYGAQVVLDHATLTITPGQRIGLVGRNGAGKSTLLKILSGDLEPDSGEVVRRRELVSGMLGQTPDLDASATVYEHIYGGASRITTMLKRLESLPGDDARRAAVEHEITIRDGWTLDNRINTLMSALAVPARDRLMATLSGGEQRRVALCRTLTAQPDLLLLDEPTNHLDTESIDWLENTISRYSGTVVLVTHDRYFLDRVTTQIVELSHGQLYTYAGNYTDFLLAKAERFKHEQAQEKQRQNFLRRELDWVQRGPKARTTKSKGRMARYTAVAEAEAPQREKNVEMLLPPAGRLGNTVVTLTDMTVDVSGTSLFTNLSFELEAGMRIGVIGKNGAGKTTLLRTLLKYRAPTAGTVEHGPLVRFNVIDQGRATLNRDNTVFDEVNDGKDFVMLGDEKISTWGYLKRFLFADERIRTVISQLSGGEQNRLLLAKNLKDGGNVLVLDEPTNDLDLETLRILEEALITFAGCVIVVSHDRYFLNRVCTGILAFEDTGRVAYQEGTYDYYVEKRRADHAEKQPAADAKTKPASNQKKRGRHLKWKDARDLETIEDRILAGEAEVTRLETIFADGDFFREHGSEAAALARDLEQARVHVEHLYQRWGELERLREMDG